MDRSGRVDGKGADQRAGPPSPKGSGGDVKLLIITEEFRAMRGGVADHTYHLGRALARKGVRTVVLTSDDAGVCRDDEVEVLPEVRAWSAFGALSILRKVRRVRPDVVNLHYVPYAYNHYGVPLYIPALAAAIRAMGIRLVTTFHEVGTRFEWRRPKYWGVALLQRVIACLLALSSSRVVVVVEHFGRMLSPFRAKVDRVPIGSNFIPVEVSGTERRRLRADIAPGGETVVATFAGGRWYRPDVVLRATKVLIDSHRVPVKLLVLGGRGEAALPGGGTLSRLAAEMGIEDAVRITGYLEERDLFRHLEAADLYVLIDMGVYGGVSAKSTALVAAYAAGLPVIGNRGRLTDSLFVHDRNIHLVDTPEADTLARAMERLAGDPERRRRLAEGGRETYEKHFAWDRIAEGYSRTLGLEVHEGAGSGDR